MHSNKHDMTYAYLQQHDMSNVQHDRGYVQLALSKCSVLFTGNFEHDLGTTKRARPLTVLYAVSIYRKPPKG